jgi:hypothetical protein
MIEEDESDGMVYSENILNRGNFSTGNGLRPKKSQGMFGDSDSEDNEDTHSFMSHNNPLKQDLGELNSLESTLDSIGTRIK